MRVVAKFFVAEKTEFAGGTSGRIIMRAVSRGDVNAVWSSASPSGTLEIHISNRPAFDALELGAEYLMTFEKAAPAELADGHVFRLDARSGPENLYYTGRCGECGMTGPEHEEPLRSELVAKTRGE